MVKQAKIERFFGERYTFYSKGFYDYENMVYLGRIWDNKLGHWVPECCSVRHPESQVTSRIVYDKRCTLRTIEGKQKTLMVSRLIYQAFHPDWDMFKDPRREQINHKEEDETCNNDLDNLELMTPGQNSNYGTRNQRVAESCRIQRRTSKSESNRSRPCICCETGQFFWSQTEASKSLGKGRNGTRHIRECCLGIRQIAYGYHWRYATEEEIQARL